MTDQATEATDPDSHEAEPGASLTGWKRVVFWGILIAIPLMIFEVGARVGLAALRGYDGEHLYQYQYDPYKNILPTPNFVDTRGIEHNSVGFRRSTEVSVEKPEDTYRVFLMGASTAYGLGGLWSHIEPDYPVLTNEQTIGAYLEQMLGDSLPGQRVEVINAAVTSTWTHHSFIYLNQSLLRYDPDMVLFLDGFNDFFRVGRRHDQFASYGYGMPAQVIMGEPTLFALAYANAWWLFRKSAAAHVASRGLQTLSRLFAERPDRTPTNVEATLELWRPTFQANALKMHERSGLILEAEGVEAVFMLQPHLILERDRAFANEVEQDLFDFNVQAYRPNYEEFMSRAMPFVVAEETAMAERVGATFLDLSRPFDGVDGQVYTDYAHLTPLGNQVVAERILEHILPIVRAEPPADR